MFILGVQYIVSVVPDDSDAEGEVRRSVQAQHDPQVVQEQVLQHATRCLTSLSLYLPNILFLYQPTGILTPFGFALV